MTIIEITPPNGIKETIKTYVTCTTATSVTDKSGSFNITIQSLDNSIFNKFPVGSDVKINQDGKIFRGWVLNPINSIEGKIKTLKLEGLSYTGRTQKIVVTESYNNKGISYIVKDLFMKYAPEYNLDSIVSCSKTISIKFNDVYLFDAMEQLATLAGYEWFIDEPVPMEVDTYSQPAGWQETVDTLIHKVYYPLESLYPFESLYPC